MHPILPEPESVSAALIQPPPGDLTGPYPALPYIKAYAEAHGHQVRVLDVGIDALWFFCQEDRLGSVLAQAAQRRAHLESQPVLSPTEQREYALLVSLAALDGNPTALLQRLAWFRNRRTFHDYRTYKSACRALDALFELLSAVHFPTVLTASEYPTAQEMNSFDRVLSHRNRWVNPYVAYYEDVLFAQLEKLNPLVVGISLEFASQSVQALALGNLIKERFPGVHVTMGGAYLSQWVLLMGDAQFGRLFTCTDSVVCGEGEESFTRLLECVAGQGDVREVPNLLARHPSSGEVTRFRELEYPDIEKLPVPDFSDLDLEDYLIPTPVIPYVISRGCYWGKCAFCQNRYGDSRMRRYQTVPVEKALTEMSELSERHGTNHFNFSNDVLDPAYLRRFSQALLSSGKKFVWNTDLRAEKSITRELCRSAAKAGLNSVAIGFESACQRTLDAMNKGKRVEDVRRVMKDLYDHGVAVQAMGILGFPGETEDEAELTIRFLEENTDRISYYVVGLLMVVPGSRMHETPEAYGVTSVSYEGNELMAPLPVWRSDKRISSAAVRRLYHRLGHLEEIFAINEYPYAGALSTNHGFLYFRQGPDVLKRLRHDERARILKLRQSLMTENRKSRKKAIESLTPRIAPDAMVYRSPFPLEEMTNLDDSPRPLKRADDFPPEHYLVCPKLSPIRLGPLERHFIEGLAGHKRLGAIVRQLQDNDEERLLGFLLHLALARIVSL